jgi:hypothetical protein
MYMLGGVQLLCMGVIGQYMVKIYFETKYRPRFIIDKTTPEYPGSQGKLGTAGEDMNAVLLARKNTSC